MRLLLGVVILAEKAVFMKNIKKFFSGNCILDGVDFSLEKGSVHALLGENGAGKSTLMNILGGLLEPDNGQVFIRGERRTSFTPSQAYADKIAFIHQEIILSEDLKVYENIFLGDEKTKGFLLNKKAMIDKSQEVLLKMKVSIDPLQKVSELNTSYRQGVEIARALVKEAEIIIMDEPTASLNEQEIQSVFNIIRTLKAQGVSFIFISHKLTEVLEICDEYTVLRDGKVADSGKLTPVITERRIAESMTGEEIELDNVYKSRNIGREVLKLEDFSVSGEFGNTDLSIKRGEIVGVTGLLGDGRSELFSAVFGCRDKYCGNIYINGEKAVHHSCRHAMKNGLAYLPSNRKENGIIKDMSLEKNITLSVLKRIRMFFFIRKREEHECTENFMKKLSIKASSPKQKITALSGGNQQKALLARALAVSPEVLILDNPAQGVDILAKYHIYNMIMELAKKGTAIFVLSGEAQEILNLCDRIYVMYDGKIVKEMGRSEANLHKIMLAQTGVEV